jgi:hypothetical protein
VIATGSGGEVRVSGSDVRERLGLRSTWFRFGVLALDPLPAKPVPVGDVATLRGIGRALGRLRLEQRAVGATAWQAAGTVKPAKDGRIEVAVKATAPTQYRLVAGRVTTTPATLRVAPRVRLQLPSAPTSVSGTVRPALGDARVWIQRAAATGSWTTVATARTDARGAFTASFAVSPGTYRARVAPGKGWGQAFSRELQVVGT